jgi:pseudouridine-5'-phosphate glycosidase
MESRLPGGQRGCPAALRSPHAARVTARDARRRVISRRALKYASLGQGVTGQAVTPAVLALVEELSDRRSVEVNQRLIADNAALAAEVAVAYAGLAAG